MKIDKPLTKEEIKKIIKDGRIEVDVDVDFDDIIGKDIELFNDMIDEKVIDEYGAYLCDINYTVMAGTPNVGGCFNGILTIRVDAEVEIYY